MSFEWDEEKNTINKEKHHIGFEDALYVFADPFAVTRNDEYEGEEVIRIISARKTTQAERRLYEEGNWF